jgi:hypothetical protein
VQAGEMTFPDFLTTSGITFSFKEYRSPLPGRGEDKGFAKKQIKYNY